MARLILASSSPRRKEMLESLGIDIEVMDPAIDEGLRDHSPVEERVCLLAEDKARAVAATLPQDQARLVLGADTLVSVSDVYSRTGGILGKPRDRQEARSMIVSLQGRTHDVHTGLALVGNGGRRLESAMSTSRVRFAAMSEMEIEEYLDSHDWEGVAGAYKIQGRAALYIEGIEGSWSGIVGLPIRELYVILKRFGFPLTAQAHGGKADNPAP